MTWDVEVTGKRNAWWIRDKNYFFYNFKSIELCLCYHRYNQKHIIGLGLKFKLTSIPDLTHVSWQTTLVISTDLADLSSPFSFRNWNWLLCRMSPLTCSLRFCSRFLVLLQGFSKTMTSFSRWESSVMIHFSRRKQQTGRYFMSIFDAAKKMRAWGGVFSSKNSHCHPEKLMVTKDP